MCHCWDRETEGKRGKGEKKRETTSIACENLSYFHCSFKTGTKVVINHSSVPHLSSPALLSFVRTLKHKEKNSEE